MNQLVLSGTATLVLSGTRSSCYRELKSGLDFASQQQSGDSNLANKKSNFVELQCCAWTTAPTTDLTSCRSPALADAPSNNVMRNIDRSIASVDRRSERVVEVLRADVQPF